MHANAQAMLRIPQGMQYRRCALCTTQLINIVKTRNSVVLIVYLEICKARRTTNPAKAGQEEAI
jgi:hypothetical protein